LRNINAGICNSDRHLLGSLGRHRGNRRLWSILTRFDRHRSIPRLAQRCARSEAQDYPDGHAAAVCDAQRQQWPNRLGAACRCLAEGAAGFVVELVANGLDNPRLLRVSPSGDVFVAESRPGRVRVLRLAQGSGKPDIRIFAEDLYQPFGIAFWPPGSNPRYVYVANTDSVVRFPYRSGDLQPAGPAETIVSGLPRGGHTTRDVVFSDDGTRMFVSVGSRSNAGERKIYAPWQSDEGRALVLAFTPEGKERRPYATGLRNCVGMAVQPRTGELWCSVNERDGLGDDLVPDFVTRVREGAFYGWPWFYIGGNEDPRRAGEQPALRSRVSVPDVLLQPHSASMEMTFYNGGQFPAENRGDVFAAFHGSWNRSRRTGYKVVHIFLRNDQPTGEYEDFLTGL
jgi:glucose/arabinose dehydrogenase